MIPAVAKPSFGIGIDLDLFTDTMPRIREIIGIKKKQPEHKFKKEIILSTKLIMA